MKNDASNPSLFSLWAPVVLYAALIFILSSFSFHLPWFQKTQKIHADKLVHVVEYVIFGVLVCRALSMQSFFKGAAGRLFITVVLVGVLYGTSDEFHQRYVPYRDSSFGDGVADTVGTALGALVWLTKIRKEYA